MRTWSRSSLYVAVGLAALGFLLMFLSWNGAAEKDFVQGQFPYLLSGGLPGVALVMCGIAVAVTQSLRRDILTLQDRLEELLSSGASPRGVQAPMLAALPDVEGAFVATASTYHRPTCRTVQGRSGFDLVTEEEAEGRGLARCRVCQPAARTA